MLAPFVLPTPPAPTGTTTLTVLCEWLTQKTGTRYAAASELRDYPVFLSVRSGDPGRITALVASALGGRWESDGKTIRLVAVKPKDGEDLAEFAHRWQEATRGNEALASLPTKEVYALPAGRILRFGTPQGEYVRPLPDRLRAKVEAGQKETGIVALRRLANGLFEVKVEIPEKKRTVPGVDFGVAFRSLPPEVVAALSDETKKAIGGDNVIEEIQKRMTDPAGQRIDLKTIDRLDPLRNLMDPLLAPVAASLKEDFVVALLDASHTAVLGLGGRMTVEDALRRLSPIDDWTMVEGALVGRLPVSERVHRAQARREAMARYIDQTAKVGFPDLATTIGYLNAQNGAASESWSDLLMLDLSGATPVDATDYPFVLRFAGLLTNGDWARLGGRNPIALTDLSRASRAALIDALANARERMGGEQPDPATWPGFPNAPMALTAKVVDEEVLVYLDGGGGEHASTVAEASSIYEDLRAYIGKEPLYRCGHRRRLALTVARPGTEEKVTMNFGEVTITPGAKAVSYKELSAATVAEFGKGIQEQRDSIDRLPPAGTAPRGG